MDHNIFSFIWRYSKRQQIYITILTLISFPFLYFSLDLPRQIIDDALSADAGPFPVPFAGMELNQVEFLLTLSFLFLALVCINGGFKYYINVYRGQLGERMLRRLRYDLYTRVLRFRLPRFKRMSAGEIIPMVTQEVEPIGGFVGDAYALPVFQGGTLLVYLGFIFIQDPILGAAAIALYPMQAYIIPKLQRHVNQLGKRRIRAVRQLSDRIGETVAATGEIHAQDTSAYHLSDVSTRLGGIFEIRYEIFRRKFFIKFLNNFLNQLTPFFFYSIGGVLVLQGSISFGALVAVLAAYKDLSGPWRELLNYYQRVEDIRIKYEQVVEQFEPTDIQPTQQLLEDTELPTPLPGPLSFSSVTYVEEDAPPALESVSIDIPIDAHIAVAGDGNSGKTEFLMLAARLLVPSQGRIKLGDHDMADLAESVTGRRFAYLGSTPVMFTDSLRGNLIYGLKHRPLVPPPHDDALAHFLKEAKASANSLHPYDADWVDYEAAGVADTDALEPRLLTLLEGVGMGEDVYRMGLNGTIDPGRQPDTAERIMAARRAVAERLQDPAVADLVERFAADAYNESATVAENLLFGTPVANGFDLDRLAENPHVLAVLDQTGLTEDFVTMGVDIARTMVELFGEMTGNTELLEQFSFISADDLPEFQPILTKIDKAGAGLLKEDERTRLMSLPFKLIPQRHRLGLIDEAMKQRLLEARRVFADTLPEDMQDAVAFFDIDAYNAAATLQDNILFGKARYGQSGVQEKVQALIAEVVDSLDLRATVMGVGLNSSVGLMGARLSGAQKQRLAVARALLKQPEWLVLDEATSLLDGGSQAHLADLIDTEMAGRGVLWGVHRPSHAARFPEVIVLHNGRVAGRGSYDELSRQGSVLASLVDNE